MESFSFRKVKNKMRGRLRMSFIGKQQWEEYGMHLPHNMRDALTRKTKEVLSKKYFRFRRASEWEELKPEVTVRLNSFLNSLNVKGNDEGWMHSWIYYLAGDGEFIFDKREILTQGITPEELAQTWAIALWACSNADLPKILGEAAFDIHLSRESDIMELWHFTATLTGHIASAVCPVLRSNPYRHLYTIYAEGLRPLVFGNLCIAVPLEVSATERVFQIYEMNQGRLELKEKRSAM